ncbi:MAG TPA: 2Fe-2S iron-sulfur cluster-binding protein [Xanthobacteraceae bacterium]|nr:2Fe-2S iron-sulfur cluster-binding protein [Xanthobacteraceae bacterium]
MPAVVFVHPDGRREEVDVPLGSSIMHAAVSAGVDGIVGECGGSAMCATCHVYVDEGRRAELPEIGPVEEEMLGSTTSERRVTSRLSCQIVMTEDLEGLILELPETQI